MPRPSTLIAGVAVGVPVALLGAADALAVRASERQPLDLPAETTHADTVSGGGGGLVRTVVGLAAVLAVIYGLTWLLRQMRASREERTSGRGLRSVASVALGPNRALHLVRAGADLVLVGVAEHGVTPIRTYTEDEARAAGLLGEDGGDEPPEQPRGSKPTLREVLEGLRRRTVRR